MTEVKTELETSIDEVTNAVAAINATQAGIAELRKKYEKVIFEVETSKGMKEAKAARQEIRQPRYEIERLRKDAKAPILALGKQLDATAKDLTAEVLAIEEPIDRQITGHEAKLEAERQEKIEAELKRVEGIQARIAEIRNAIEPVAWDTDARDIAIVITRVADIVIDETFAEFEDQANDAKVATLARLREMHESAKARETEEARIAAERAELEKLRAEQAEREAKEAAERKTREDKERREREAKEAAERKKREAEESKRRKELAAQQKKIDAENARIAKEKRAREAEETAARERNEIALGEIQGIQHQVLIARTGRSGHVKGGTVEGVDKLIAETEAWEITTEKFGGLTASAEAAKQSAVSNLKQYRADLVREQDEKAAAERKAKAERDDADDLKAAIANEEADNG